MPTEPPAIPTTWSVSPAFPNLSYSDPMGLTPIPGTNKLVEWEREGQVYSFDNDPNTATKTLILDLSAHCQGWDDCGLMSLVFHPNFQVNHYIYVLYTWTQTPIGSATSRPSSGGVLTSGAPLYGRLSRFTLDDNGVAVPGSEYVLFNQLRSSTWHVGGGMFINPLNGFLYVTLGDDDNTANTQIINKSFHSCVLRLDVDKRGGSISHVPVNRALNENGPNWPNAYTIPNDNPFPATLASGTTTIAPLQEIYALGLRSPHRMSYDAASNRVFIGDVGEGTYEELDTIEPTDPAGLNFQWNKFEGWNGLSTPPQLTGTYYGFNKAPILDYRHGNGNQAVIGGCVYRGTAFPELVGKYIFGDNTSNNVWMLDESTESATTQASKVPLATIPTGPGNNTGSDYRHLSSFGLDANGEIYMCNLSSPGGGIYKLLKQGGGGGTGSPLPATLSLTGVFSDLVNLTPSSKLIPYALNAPFWSDGAIKTRWAAIPNNTTISFAPTGEWSFPEGSVFVKHFELAASDPSSATQVSNRRLETRLLVKMSTGGVYGATYRWREDNSDADLLYSSTTENIAIYTGTNLTSSTNALATIAIGLTGTGVGSMTQPSSGSTNYNDVTIIAGGSDVWGSTDQFRYSYFQRTGDFDLRTQVISLAQANAQTKACLMARTSLTGSSAFVSAIAYPAGTGRSFNMEWRAATGASAQAITPVTQPAITYPNVWLRLRREGTSFTSYYGTSGTGNLWTTIGNATIALPTTLYVGLAVCAHTSSATTTAKFHLLPDTRSQVWYYPSTNDCVTCHTQQTGGPLGLKTRQLNLSMLYPSSGTTDNQIRTWNHIGLFSHPPLESDIATFDKLSAVTDSTASLQQRARSYFDSNCSQCHRPGGVQAQWDARYDTPILQQGIINGNVGNDLGISGAKIVAPQSLAQSLIYYRVNRVGLNQMPPLARNQIDTNAVTMLTSWINSLPTSNVIGPTNNSAFIDTDTIILSASGAPGNGSIARVEFWDNGTKLGQITSGPYMWTLQGPLKSGVHVFTVVVYDTQSGGAPSSAVTVNVMPLQLTLSSATSLLGNPPVINVHLQTTLPSGRQYVVQRSDDLTNWQTLQSGVATGQSMDIQSSQNTLHRYFRLQVLP